MRFKPQGFNLVELMITVAIIGILSAVAIPTYSGYVTKSSLSKAVGTLDYFKKIIIEDATLKGGVQNQVQTEIGPLTKATSTAFNAAPVAFLYYNVVDKNSFYICASLTGLGISDGVDPSSGNDGTKNRLCLYATKSNGVYSTRCGNLNNSDAQNLPPDVMPSSCNCQNVTTGVCDSVTATPSPSPSPSPTPSP